MREIVYLFTHNILGKDKKEIRERMKSVLSKKGTVQGALLIWSSFHKCQVLYYEAGENILTVTLCPHSYLNKNYYHDKV